MKRIYWLWLVVKAAFLCATLALRCWFHGFSVGDVRREAEHQRKRDTLNGRSK
jgi:hypothetical protein